MQCFGNGDNIVPTIHVNDLASVVVNICDQRPKVRYMVAVDESKNTLEEIVKVSREQTADCKYCEETVQLWLRPNSFLLKMHRARGHMM